MAGSKPKRVVDILSDFQRELAQAPLEQVDLWLRQAARLGKVWEEVIDALRKEILDRELKR